MKYFCVVNTLTPNEGHLLNGKDKPTVYCFLKLA